MLAAAASEIGTPACGEESPKPNMRPPSNKVAALPALIILFIRLIRFDWSCCIRRFWLRLTLGGSPLVNWEILSYRTGGFHLSICAVLIE
jgi:hypothetical protein